ncbi:MAG: hypothetical protein EAX90_01500 [Candidatus Heimdallarchaeota archaeon]|nr:hypothetical protein [Candidatus Heimdallarchaeota archaeon]
MKMVKPGAIIGGFIVAISIALQVVTLLEIAPYYWLLFIWAAGAIAGGFYVAGGLAFGESEKMEHFTISGIGSGAIVALSVYFGYFQFDAIDAVLFLPNQLWVIGAVGFSALSGILVAISCLFMATGAGRELKGVKPGAIIGGFLISLSLTLQIVVVIHIKRAYWLLVFWFIGLVGAIALSAGARAKGYSSTESFVIAGVSIGILLFLVLYFTLSQKMINAMDLAQPNITNPPTHEMSAIWATIMSFISGLVAFAGVLFSAASLPRRGF